VTPQASADAADDADGDVRPTTVEAPAAPFYAFSDLLTCLVDEAKVRVRDDGLHCTAVDPANVGMVDVHFPPDAFDRYDFGGDYTAGVNLKRLRSAVGFAHKGQGPDGGDPVTWTLSPEFRKTQVEVEREDGAMTMTERWSTIDPQSVRQEPDLPDIDLVAQADPPTKVLRDGVRYLLQQDYSHVSLHPDGSEPTTLLLTAEGDTSEATLSFPESVYPDEAVSGGDPRALYSLDYFKDMASAIHLSRMDKVTLNWGPEFPVKLHFQSEDWGADGTMMLAPRIQSD
jgi:proliferating cell nuclear antigen